MQLQKCLSLSNLEMYIRFKYPKINLSLNHENFFAFFMVK